MLTQRCAKVKCDGPPAQSGGAKAVILKVRQENFVAEAMFATTFVATAFLPHHLGW
jgi:hypothetical protein